MLKHSPPDRGLVYGRMDGYIRDTYVCITYLGGRGGIVQAPAAARLSPARTDDLMPQPQRNMSLSESD
jgi:hypothetical protein